MRRDQQLKAQAVEAQQQKPSEVAAKPRRLFERTAEPFIMEQQQQNPRAASVYSRDAARLRTVMASGRGTSGTTQRSQEPESGSGNEELPVATRDAVTPATVASVTAEPAPAPASTPEIRGNETDADTSDRRETRLRVVMTPSHDAATRETAGAVKVATTESAAATEVRATVAAPSVPAQQTGPVQETVKENREQPVVNEQPDPGRINGAQRPQDTYKRFDPAASSTVSTGMVIQPEISYTPRHFPKRSIWSTIPLALTVGIGILIAVGLYVGGSDLLARVFGNANEGITQGNPAAITERPRPAGEQLQDQSQSMTTSSFAGGGTETGSVAQGNAATSPATPIPAEMITSAVTEPKQPEALPQPTATAQPVAEKPVKPALIVTSPGATAPVAATATPSEKKKEKKGATETRPTEGQPKVNAPKEPRVKAVASDSPTEISEAKGTIYNVQVRATTDQAEADLVVKRLKRKGFGNVTILQSEKNGAPFFRIRFGSFTSKEEATAAAGSSGYSGTWVVRQR